MHRHSVRRGVAAAVVSAAMLIAVVASPASAIVLEDQVQEVADSVSCVQPAQGSACYNGAAQTVTVGRSGQLTAVHLLLSRADFASAALTVEIHASTPTGALLATSDPVPATAIPVSSVGSPPQGALSNEDWVLFSFPSPAAVTVGDVLAIVLPYNPIHVTTDVGWGWAKAATNVYGGGTAFGGSSGSGWAAYVDGSDFAFATYVAAGAPTCELSAWIGNNELTAPVVVTAGQSVDLWFEDYPPFGDMVVTFVMAGAEPDVYDDAADAFGDSWWTWETQPSEIGSWLVTGEAVGTGCAATLAVTIQAVPVPTTSPTVAPTPAPTPLPTTTPPPAPTTAPAPTATPVSAVAAARAAAPAPTVSVTLPPTSTAATEPAGGAAELPLVILFLVVAAAVTVASARFSMRRA